MTRSSMAIRVGDFWVGVMRPENKLIVAHGKISGEVQLTKEAADKFRDAIAVVMFDTEPTEDSEAVTAMAKSLYEQMEPVPRMIPWEDLTPLAQKAYIRLVKKP